VRTSRGGPGVHPKGNNLLLLSVSLLLVTERLGLPVSKEEDHTSRDELQGM
jgi:hypothetical protein